MYIYTINNKSNVTIFINLIKFCLIKFLDEKIFSPLKVRKFRVGKLCQHLDCWKFRHNEECHVNNDDRSCKMSQFSRESRKEVNGQKGVKSAKRLRSKFEN